MNKFILSNGKFVWSTKSGNGFATITPPKPPYEPPVKVDTDLRPTQFMEITRNNNDLEVK